ncbi:MAG TPA: hypothetical protein PLV68_16250, partial [Ilumatobacteraceae bacterium]|nr:hypothetical protein [Ilumatobacteraceae bacterium]
MDAKAEPALSVVAVMVVHRPTDHTAVRFDAHFDELLRALAAQDYPNLKTLFLIAGEPGDLAATIRAKVPGAFVRPVGGNPGYGPAANEV